jgi:hypothetical protein
MQISHAALPIDMQASKASNFVPFSAIAGSGCLIPAG